MKKHLISLLAIMVMVSAPAYSYVTTATTNPANTSDAITNPNAGISGLKPGVNDTYYTHYKTITGYKSKREMESGKVNKYIKKLY